MTINASDVLKVADLMQQRLQLKSRQARVASVVTLPEILALLQSTSVEAEVLKLAQTQVAGFIDAAIADVEAKITAYGVFLDQ